MKVACVGGGPAGLYFAISMMLRDPSHDITVFERNRAGDTFGWGVVFSDQTMEHLQANDPVSAQSMIDELAHWDDIEVHIEDVGRNVTNRSSGHGFIGIGRKRLLNILQDRARALGVKLEFEIEIEPDSDFLADYDLVIAADGLNSKLRRRYEAEFAVDLDVKRNKFVWLGTRQKFDAFNFIFKHTRFGWIWAHAYQFDADTATFIVECGPEAYERAGFGRISQQETCRLCEEIFADHLGGHELMTNAGHIRGSAWINFPRIICRQWSYRNIVLLGDAAHTAHFSIGSGTKLALEDAIKLAEVMNRPGFGSGEALQQGLEEYQAERQLEVVKLQNAARNSTEWFEHLDRYLKMDAMQFTYTLLTRSQRVSHENLRLRDPIWLAALERSLAETALCAPVETPVPPMFLPFRLRGMTLRNRVVMSPMAMYSAVDGVPDDFHLVHYGARALGGAGLIVTEMTCVSPEARITPGCTGLWNAEQAAAWRRITDFVHRTRDTRICMQLGHSGSKGSTRVAWEGMDEPLAEGNWPLVAPSDVAWSADNQVPSALTRAQMDEIRDQFVQSTRYADEAGFDMVELHCGHGYLLSGFISPIQNRRSDDYGGSLDNRLRYPLEVFRAMRAVWPKDKPMSVRISATDWMGDAGVTPEDAVEIARAFTAAGADLIDVSAGQVTRDQKPVYGRMFQTPFSDQIRNELGVATMAVGNIYEVDHVNSIVAAGRADLCAIGRPHQMNPNWTIEAAAAQGLGEENVPVQYLSGYAQLKLNKVRAAQMAAAQ
ncbi:bifunctional salicylyl-CoA 5-hydroxylase/oxidoreductase [Sphingomonas lycopersici]|uniref:Bifunctional salicylyl-CoA 5-hydroxylase/oxidoreductase n=1 Tax=Sphingomonas lycopersici TaxID=2951807 RepID=A0AA41Z649_9SPHN|nr:bifunctional salicylyl-CoA 5-hydroxylase/oxidoreductase [Sphingomonas lycopersici]MCW6533618.1 bifunctional salicylyl-CoA 5-hydroxylase/oxidoreductase [Sphingomonas lycopersici]